MNCADSRYGECDACYHGNKERCVMAGIKPEKVSIFAAAMVILDERHMVRATMAVVDAIVDGAFEDGTIDDMTARFTERFSAPLDKDGNFIPPRSAYPL